MRFGPSIAGVLATGILLAGTPHPPVDPDRQFQALAEAYLPEYFASHPVRATRLGIHEHDGALPDLSREGIAKRIDRLGHWRAQLEAIDGERLDGDAFYDYRILDHAIRAELLELQEVRSWRHNPRHYTQVIAESLASLVDRRFAPLERRLPLLLERMQQLPQVFGAARRNLRDVPEVFAEIALAEIQGTVNFIDFDLADAVRAQGLAGMDPDLVARWERLHRRTVRRVTRFGEWVRRSVLANADGDFRLGRDLFERKLRYEEHVDLSVDELEALNEAAIRDYRRRVAETARRIDSVLPPATVMERITHDYPASDELIDTARRQVAQAREFVVARGIVTLPTETLPTIRPSPPYARSGFASMSVPGPFETEARESYFNITNVDPAWTDEQRAQHLTYFNYSGLLGISVHESMPGHFVQMLYQRELVSDVRKVFAPASLVEGWAHYVEQMMVDEGLGGGTPEVRLGQLRRALQRHARWYAGLALHVRGESLESTSERFEEIAFFAPFPALRETRRATYNPTYLYYALGRMQILELREDYRKHREAQGQTFSLREFHDTFLRMGLPISLARRVLIPDAEDEPSGSDGEPDRR